MANTPYWLYNGVPFPAPARGLEMLGQQLVQEGRNANGRVTIDMINRMQDKFNNVRFPIIDYATAEKFIRHVNNRTVTVTYWDIVSGGVINRKFYFGNLSWEPLHMEDVGAVVLKPKTIRNLQCNLVDMGLEDEDEV